MIESSHALSNDHLLELTVARSKPKRNAGGSCACPVFLMHILRAYCVEVGRILDIYQARALFFAQEKPRRRLQFECSDDACRAMAGTKVTAVNYDKLVAEGDQIVLKPHFRMNPQSPHIEACEWLAREKLIAQRDAPDADERKPGRPGFRHLKSGDLVDMYVPCRPATSVASEAWKESEPAQSGERDNRWRRERGVLRKTRGNLNRTNSLETVVTVYELLEPC